jgi:hypothetical protein
MPKRNTGDPCFSSSESSEQAKFFCQRPRSIHRSKSMAIGFSGPLSFPWFSKREAPWFQTNLDRPIQPGQMAAHRHIGYRSFKEQAPLVSCILKPRTPNFRWRPKLGPWFWRLVIKMEAWGRGVYVCNLATRAPKRRTKSQREGTVMFQIPIRRGLNPSTCWGLMKKREGGSNLTSLIYCRA